MRQCIAGFSEDSMPRLRTIVLPLLITILATGCNLQINMELPFGTLTPIPATPAVIVITSTFTPVKSTSVPAQPTIGATTSVKLFFIALNDDGKSGKAVG